MADRDKLQLIDQWGNPISSVQLATPVAQPGAANGRPPFEGHRAFGINPAQLGAYLRAADNGSTRDWFALCEEIEELFPHYTSVLAKRKRQVSLLPITVIAANEKKCKDAEKHAEFVRDWLDTEVLERAIPDIMDAVAKGYSVNEIMWDSAPGCVWPKEILWRHQRDFEVSWEDGETIWLRDMAGYTELAPHKFLLHVHKTKSGGAARSGTTRIISWMWMYATFNLKDWALFVQGYGLPVRLGRYGPEASEPDKRTLFRAVRQIAGDLAAIIPKSMEMEFVQPGNLAGASELYLHRANWLNYETSKVVLGGTAGTDAVAGGHAVGQEHRAGEQDVEKYDARVIAGSVNRQIVPAMIAFTFGPQAAYPRIRIGEDEQVPLSDVIASIADLGPLGFKVKADELRDRLQLTKPEDGDEVIGPPPPAPAGAGQVDPNDPEAAAAMRIKANPHPEINPTSDARVLMTRNSSLRRLIAMHTARQAADEQLIEGLEARVAKDAGEALAQMTAEIRACFDAAEDYGDLARRLQALQLDPAAFATAMMQGMSLADLAGQAALLDEIAPGDRSLQS